MTDRPILYSAAMIRAQLEGRKGQTRRILKPQPDHFHRDIIGKPQPWSREDWNRLIPQLGDKALPVRFAKGDKLWVRETWRTNKTLDHLSPTGIADLLKGEIQCPVRYEADGATVNGDKVQEWGKTRVAIHMPRWASRLTNTVTDVRVQRLQEISEEDARAEGIWSYEATDCDGDPRADGKIYRQTFWHWRRDIEQGDGYSTAVSAYRHLWGDINGAGSWDANPWVTATTFTVEHRNIDQTKG